MLRALWNTRSGMMAQQAKLDAISNNIANANTDGYKRNDVSFRDLVYETLDRNGYPLDQNVKTSTESGTGAKASDFYRDDTQGNLKVTDLNTDLSIDGEGMFKVTMQDGSTAYTRSSAFNTDSNGNLVDKKGNILNIDFYKVGDNGNLKDGENNISISPYNVDSDGNIKDSNGKSINVNINNIKFTKDNFKVDESGNLSIQGKDYTVNVGKIKLYTATGDDAFISIGDNLYKPNEGVQVYNADKSNILQGYTELSNVDISKEMTDMIMTQRAFELSSRGMKTVDEMMGMANNLRSR